jgi:hypothetical protein
MMTQRGRVFLNVDGPARVLDRTVDRTVSLVYYPTGASSDRPIEVRIELSRDRGRVLVTVAQDREELTREILATIERPAGKEGK